MQVRPGGTAARGRRTDETDTTHARIRKVKCDESKPSCQRCSKTGRKCDGYPEKARGVYSWDELLGAQAVVVRSPGSNVGCSDMESRALQFFRLEVAPVLSRHSSKHFWTQLVSQVGQQEAAVRHALVSISSMYEGMGGTGGQSPTGPPGGEFAIDQYNKALKQLTATKPPDESMVLFVCLLFVCIESLQGNKRAAIDHCGHGIQILNTSTRCSAWARHYLLPLFLRLSIFPFFFGKTADNFPHLVDLGAGISAPGITLDDSHMALDYLLNRVIRFVRSSDVYRLGVKPLSSIPEPFYQDQRDVAQSLAAWQSRFADFKQAHPPSEDEVQEHLGLEMKSLVAKIWLACCIDPTETEYDHHMAGFQGIVDLARRLLLLKTPASEGGSAAGHKPKFIFEMGFMPLLYFTVIKCRALHVRLAALQFMDLLACDRESLWDAKVMHSVGRRVIEREHGISLDATALGAFLGGDVLMPPHEARIRDSMVLDNAETRLDADGRRASYREVCFLFGSPGGGVMVAVNEWVRIRSGLEEGVARPVAEAAGESLSFAGLEALDWPLSCSETLQA